MSLVVRASADGSGVELPFETVCKCFDVLSAPDADRHKRPDKLKRLWDVYGLRTHPLFELMRLILPQVSDSRPAQMCGGAHVRPASPSRFRSSTRSARSTASSTRHSPRCGCSRSLARSRSSLLTIQLPTLTSWQVRRPARDQ